MQRVLLELFRELNQRGEFTFAEGFECNYYRLKRGQKRWTITVSPNAPLAWQVLTGWIFASLAVRHVYGSFRLKCGLPSISIFEITCPPDKSRSAVPIEPSPASQPLDPPADLPDPADPADPPDSRL